MTFMSGCVSKTDEEKMQLKFEGTRQNGHAWMSYGPAIINCCKMITVSMGLNGREVNVSKIDGPKLEKIKAWLMYNFKYKMDKSPEYPKDRSFFYLTVTLYASTQGGQQNVLMVIPLNRLTLRGIEKKKELITIIWTEEFGG